MIEEARIRQLNRSGAVDGHSVVYWMQASQRAVHNHALEFAIQRANELRKPLVVYFGLTEGYPEANARHYQFMLEGIRSVHEELRSRGIAMLVERGSPDAGVVRFAREAALLVCDRGYMRIQRRWRQAVARGIRCPLVQVESDVVVPVEAASGKEEYSAATLRRKLWPLLPRYLVPLAGETPRIDSSRTSLSGFEITDAGAAAAKLSIDRSVEPVPGLRGGTAAAMKRLEEFLNAKLDRYQELRNDPNEDGLSNLSPYLHFGQISPVSVAIEVARHGGPGSEAFLEELVVRRELSINFVTFNENYDSFAGVPDWAQRTLLAHATDRREHVYSAEQLEKAATHDPYWNAAQMQMVVTGKMHGYMRMYWGKKILEWTRHPADAYAVALHLNNKYELDGRDPNGFAGIAWCFGKHDRPWGRRPIFGNVRYMNAAGLKRKFDAERYARTHLSQDTKRPPETSPKDDMKR